MEKYFITEVIYRENHITMVKYRLDKDTTYGSEVSLLSREEVVNSVKQGNIFQTFYIDETGVGTRGDIVEIIKVNGIDFIKTLGNDTEGDNLGELPTF
jgi:hypothetical protein